jgi:hypothetical protein
MVPAQFLPGSGLFANCTAVSISSDASRVAVTTLPGSLMVLNAQTGALLQNLTLPGASGVDTIAWQDLRPDATYTTYGSGCAGSSGTPTMTMTSLPRLGTAPTVRVDGVPLVAALVTGFSDSIAGPFTLPLSLAQFGMPGCSLLTDVVDTKLGFGPTAKWNFILPGSPLLLGTVFFNQAIVFDAAANAAGFTTSNGGRGVVGIIL